MKLLKKAKRVHQISEDFAYLSYFENTSMDMLVWSNYKVYVGNDVRLDLLFRQND